MRILYLAQRVPFPPTRGDKILTFHQIRHLAREHDVAVACLADGAADLDNVAGLTGLVTSVDAVPIRRARARLRAGWAPVAGRSLTRAYFDEPALHARVRSRLRHEAFDAAIVYSSGMAQYVEHLGSLPRIMQFTDLDSQKWAQYAGEAWGARRWAYRREARCLLEYERYLARTFDHSLVVSAEEVKDFRRLIPGAPVTCVSNGVNADYFRPVTGRPAVPHSMVFVGVMDYRPNVQGVIWFCDQILPRVREVHPDATFTICGARPSAAVKALARRDGVTVTGAVPDVRPFLNSAEVCVVPLQMGRGVQNKVLEALAMGLPTVVTPSAVSGIAATDGAQLLVGRDASAFAHLIGCCFADRSLRQRLSTAARSLIERRYQWDAALRPLDDVIADVVARSRLQGEGQPRQAGGHAEQAQCAERLGAP